MTIKLTPVVIFLYNRPEHTKQMLFHLSENQLADETQIFIFIDGPKNDEDIVLQKQIKNIIENFQSKFKSTHITHSPTNKGLATSVIEGVSKIVNEYKQVIVLEDDILTSPVFLSYMNKCLELYKDKKQIYSINAYMFPIPVKDNFIFLSPLATSSWGWGTWNDRWLSFNKELKFKDVISNNQFLRRRFNVGDLNYIDYMNNENSWAIRWYYSVFSRNGLGVFPSMTLVQNIGFDGSGTNCGSSNVIQEKINQILPKLELLDTIDFNTEALLQNHFKSSEHKRGLRVAASKVKRAVKKILFN